MTRGGSLVAALVAVLAVVRLASRSDGTVCNGPVVTPDADDAEWDNA